MAIAVFLRYFSIIAQFFIIALVTRKMQITDAGLYMQIFGLVATLYFLSGLGLPDGVVPKLARARIEDPHSNIKSFVLRSYVWTFLINILLACVLMLFAVRFNGSTVMLGVAWWFLYSINFLGSQIFVGIGEKTYGALFFYPAMNLAQIGIVMPYLLFKESVGLDDLLVVTVISSLACVLVGVGVLCWCLRKMNLGDEVRLRFDLADVFGAGIYIAFGRFIQTALIWMPVWLSGFIYGAMESALAAAASRVNSAVGSAMSAVRFSIRARIVELSVKNEWAGLQKELGRISAYATLLMICILISAYFWSGAILEFVFGDDYGGARVYLLILLIATLVESAAGPVDELLKMNRRSGVVFSVLCCTLVLEIFLVLVMRDRISYAPFWVHAVCFSLMYVSYIVMAKRMLGVNVLDWGSARRS